MGSQTSYVNISRVRRSNLDREESVKEFMREPGDCVPEYLQSEKRLE